MRQKQTDEDSWKLKIGFSNEVGRKTQLKLEKKLRVSPRTQGKKILYIYTHTYTHTKKTTQISLQAATSK